MTIILNVYLGVVMEGNVVISYNVMKSVIIILIVALPVAVVKATAPTLSFAKLTNLLEITVITMQNVCQGFVVKVYA